MDVHRIAPYTAELLARTFHGQQHRDPLTYAMDYLKLLCCTSEKLPFIILTGERASGKTTLLNWLVPLVGTERSTFTSKLGITASMLATQRLIVAEEVPLTNPSLESLLLGHAAVDVAMHGKPEYKLRNQACFILTSSRRDQYPVDDRRCLHLHQVRPPQPDAAMSQLLMQERHAFRNALRAHRVPPPDGRYWLPL